MQPKLAIYSVQDQSLLFVSWCASNEAGASVSDLTDNENKLLQLLCSDKSYKEIADSIFRSRRTIEGDVRNLCKKLNIKTRTGLVLFAVRNGVFVV